MQSKDNYEVTAFDLDSWPKSYPTKLPRWQFRQSVLANVRGAGEPASEHDFPPGIREGGGGICERTLGNGNCGRTGRFIESMSRTLCWIACVHRAISGTFPPSTIV